MMKFIKTTEKNGVSIMHYELIEFLSSNGYRRMRFPNGGVLLVKLYNNVITETQESELVNCIQNHLIKFDDQEALEKFAKGLSGYLNKRKYDLLPEIEGFIDKDEQDSCWMYFKNCAFKITSKGIKKIKYKQVKHPIWSKRILDKELNNITNSKGQFRDFFLSYQNPMI